MPGCISKLWEQDNVPYLCRLSAEINGKDTTVTVNSASKIKGVDFKQTTDSLGRQITIFRLGSTLFLNKVFWVCEDEYLIDSKKYLFNNNIYTIYDIEDYRWHNRYVGYDYWNHWLQEGYSVVQMIFSRDTAPGKVISGWMSFTKDVEEPHLSFVAKYEVDVLHPRGDTIKIRNGRLDIAKKLYGENPPIE